MRQPYANSAAVRQPYGNAAANPGFARPAPQAMTQQSFAGSSVPLRSPQTGYASSSASRPPTYAGSGINPLYANAIPALMVQQAMPSQNTFLSGVPQRLPAQAAQAQATMFNRAAVVAKTVSSLAVPKAAQEMQAAAPETPRAIRRTVLIDMPNKTLEIAGAEVDGKVIEWDIHIYGFDFKKSFQSEALQNKVTEDEIAKQDICLWLGEPAAGEKVAGSDFEQTGSGTLSMDRKEAIESGWELPPKRGQVGDKVMFEYISAKVDLTAVCDFTGPLFATVNGSDPRQVCVVSEAACRTASVAVARKGIVTAGGAIIYENRAALVVTTGEIEIRGQGLLFTAEGESESQAKAITLFGRPGSNVGPIEVTISGYGQHWGQVDFLQCEFDAAALEGFEGPLYAKASGGRGADSESTQVAHATPEDKVESYTSALEKQELIGQFSKEFKKRDVDKDGFVSRSDFEASCGGPPQAEKFRQMMRSAAEKRPCEDWKESARLNFSLGMVELEGDGRLNQQDLLVLAFRK